MENFQWDLDELIRRTQQGEQTVIEHLAEKFRKFMFNKAYIHLHHRQDAEDIAQEASVKAIMAIERFKVGTNLWAWLSKIAMNCIADFLRKRYGMTNWPLKVYRRWVFDFIYLIDQQLRDSIDQIMPEAEHQSFYARITEDVSTKTFRQFQRLKYETPQKNAVLSRVKELLHEHVGIEVIPLPTSTDGDGDVGIEDIPDTEIDPKKILLKKEFVAKVNAYIEALPSDEQKLVVRLCYFAGLKVKEISQLSGKTPNAVSQMLNEARKNLKSMMENDDYFEEYFRCRKKN